jgi:proteic killer suppression protein
MIVDFGDSETETIWNGEGSRRLPLDIQAVALRKLRLIDAAGKVDDLRVPPGNRLEKLSGDRTGQWSIRINDQWRIVFRWAEGGAEHVAIADYH